MTIYLHHYPASPYSEKIRAILGHLQLPWCSVVIPSIMPRPLLMPLSGGYRRTPVLQIGANVHCDSAAIARGLARHAGDATLYAPGFVAQRTAEWADTQLFRVGVALNFAPEAVGAMMKGIPQAEVAAFAKDRASLTEGASLQTIPPDAARACLGAWLAQLEDSLGGAFLFGDTPSIADFSVYHGLWFLRNNEVNAPLLEPFGEVHAWMERVAALGHGKPEDATGEQALAHARESEPVLPELEAEPPPGLSLGDSVAVTPTDYGRVPVEGRLAALGPDEIVIEREHEETGRVLNHFPRVGFALTKA